MISVVVFVIGICKMSDKKPERPPDGSPEMAEWLAQKCKQDFNDIRDNHQPAEFEKEGRVILMIWIKVMLNYSLMRLKNIGKHLKFTMETKISSSK